MLTQTHIHIRIRIHIHIHIHIYTYTYTRCSGYWVLSSPCSDRQVFQTGTVPGFWRQTGLSHSKSTWLWETDRSLPQEQYLALGDRQVSPTVTAPSFWRQTGLSQSDSTLLWATERSLRQEQYLALADRQVFVGQLHSGSQHLHMRLWAPIRSRLQPGCQSTPPRPPSHTPITPPITYLLSPPPPDILWFHLKFSTCGRFPD